MAVNIIFAVLGFTGFAFGAISMTRLAYWHRHLTRIRIVVAYKGRSRINRPIIDWVRWGESADKDKAARGHVIYNVGKTTVAVLEPLHKDATKVVDKVVKPK